MQFRFAKTLTMFTALYFLCSCTTRHQDLLRDRDNEIRNLTSRVAALRAEKDDLERQLTSERTAQKPVAQPENAAFPNQDLQAELGGDASVDYRRGRMSINVEDTVTFDAGSDKLKDSAHKVLKKIATVLKRDYADCRIYVEGHTDNDPIKKTKNLFLDNRELSAKRANAVARYLIEQGVPESQMLIVGYGPIDPIDPKSKDRNRRVSIVPTQR